MMMFTSEFDTYFSKTIIFLCLHLKMLKGFLSMAFKPSFQDQKG
jgi:hypothetical protein